MSLIKFMSNDIVIYGSLRFDFIGKGCFSRVYRRDDEVFIFIRKKENKKNNMDYSKEAIEIFADKDNPHIPKIQYLESYQDYEVYSCPYYRPLVSQNKICWNLYKIIKKISQVSEDTKSFLIRIQSCEELTENIKEAIVSILYAMSNYTTDLNKVAIDISPKNFGVDKNNNLILLDIIYDRDYYLAMWRP